MTTKEKSKEVATKKDVGTQVINRVNSLCELGFKMPKDYNYVNAIKASMMKLEEKDKNGKSLLDKCDMPSIQKGLFKMCTSGLNLALNQCYAIPRGGHLCIDPSYFGHILQVKRIYPNFDPCPRVVRKDDLFRYETDIETGRIKLVEHEQKLENKDKDFVGAYMYLPCSDGGKDLYIMTRKQIMAAWSQSATSQSVHKQFDEKMVKKTIINSGCNTIINSTPETATLEDDESDDNMNTKDDSINDGYKDFEEIEESVEEAVIVDDKKVDKETGEIKEQEKPKHSQEIKENTSEVDDESELF